MLMYRRRVREMFFEEVLKDAIKKQLDEAYEEYKQEKLKDLDAELELQRNRVLTEILNSISIVQEKNMLNEPCINITLAKKYVIGE